MKWQSRPGNKRQYHDPPSQDDDRQGKAVRHTQCTTIPMDDEKQNNHITYNTAAQNSNKEKMRH